MALGAICSVWIGVKTRAAPPLAEQERALRREMDLECPLEWSVADCISETGLPDLGTPVERSLEMKEKYALTSMKQERWNCNELSSIDT